MSVTAQNIITRAYQALQAIGNTEVPSAAESNDALTSFNALLDSWSLDNDIAYEIEEQSFPFTIGTSAYTIGTGGTINTERPQDIIQAYVRDTGNNDFLMKILTRDRWNMIGNRGSGITSQIPNTLFYDQTYPLGIINVFPTPLLAYRCFFTQQLNQVTFATLTQVLSMPKGYERAFVFNLAVEISAMTGIPIPAAPGGKTVGQLAAESLAAVKEQNIEEVIADYDSALVSRSNTYNIFRGG